MASAMELSLLNRTMHHDIAANTVSHLPVPARRASSAACFPVRASAAAPPAPAAKPSSGSPKKRGQTEVLEMLAADEERLFLRRAPSSSPITPEAMSQLLLVVLLADPAMAAALLFETPLWKVAVLGLDRLDCGRRTPVTVKTVAGVVPALLASTLYSISTA